MYPDSVSRVHFLFVLIYGKSGFFIKFVKTYSISIKMGEHICFRRNERLATVNPYWRGNPMVRGRFFNRQHRFRPGMVPMSLVKKMYGKSVIADEVNKLLSEKVYAYIKDNNINILGEPMPNEEKQQVIDFDTMDDFEFVFDIALAPEFKAEVSSSDKVDYYTIEVTDEMVENQIKAYTQRNGKYEKVDAYEENDMLKGLLAELDEEGNTKEGGIQVEGAEGGGDPGCGGRAEGAGAEGRNPTASAENPLDERKAEEGPGAAAA